MIDVEEPWRRVRRDLIVSVLIAGGNALVASVAIVVLHLSYPAGMFVAFALAFGGIGALRKVTEKGTALFAWLRGHAARDSRRGACLDRVRQGSGYRLHEVRRGSRRGRMRRLLDASRQRMGRPHA